MKSYIGIEDNFLLENAYLVASLEEIVTGASDAMRFSPEDIDEIFRITHTIKSSAGIMMYDNISLLAHRLEDVFYYLREKHPENVSYGELSSGILEVADFITDELYKIRCGHPADGDAAGIMSELSALLDRVKDNQKIALPENRYQAPKQFYVAAKAGEAKNYYRIKLYFPLGTQMSNVRAYAAVFLLEEIADEMIYAPPDITARNADGEINQNGFHVQIATQSGKEEIRLLLESSSGEKEIEIHESSVEEFIRGFSAEETPALVINLDDAPAYQGHDVVAGSYVIKKDVGGGKRFHGKPGQVAPPQGVLLVPLANIDRLTELVNKLPSQPSLMVELQKLVLSMKKDKVGSLFPRMERAVYAISRRQGKVVDFESAGGEVEIDRNILARVSEALLHMIRNAIDHGIEEKESRRAAGKRAKGKVVLAAGSKDGEVFISLRDDGRGLNIARIREEARVRGLDTEDIGEIITTPGFTTCTQVTEFSGRGVGLDVVAQDMREIGGRLEVASEAGQWTEMVLWVPG